METEILYTIVHDGLKFVVKTDHLTDCRLWIKVYYGDSIIFQSLCPLVSDNMDNTPWQKCGGFYWPFLEYKVDMFSADVQRRLDSYFKLKAFW